jgi:acid stress-induced BolA-like protein IbaG/YrbA
MMPLTQAFASSVHALALKTFTPEKWELAKHKYQGVT